MSYTTFLQETTRNHSDFFATQVDIFFTKAVELATHGMLEDSITLANEAMIFAKYADSGYSTIYLVGLLCEAHLHNDQPEFADKYFKYGMAIIEEHDIAYTEDLNRFLDLKSAIDSALKPS